MTRKMFAAMSVMVLGAALLASNTLAGNSILLEFSSPHCPPCQAMKPVLQQLERSGVPIRHVDVSTEPQLASRYGVRSTPTFIVVNDGQEVTRLVGMQTVAKLNEALAASPSGPLIPTRSTQQNAPAPQTQLASQTNLTPQTQLAPISAAALDQPGFAAPAAAESMPSLSVADAIQRAQAATVRLRVFDGHGHGAGTGTIIDTHGDEALVLTCGHLFRETKGEGKIEVDLFVAGETRTVLGQVVDYDADTRDIALVAIRTGFPVQPVQVVGADSRVENGQTAFSFGCDRGDDPSRRDTRITGINKYNQHLGVSNLEISGAPIEGRSGGGLFDASGRLIGVCNAADYKGDVGIYAGPGSIQWQLDRAGLEKLYQDQAPASSPSPRGVAPSERIASLPESNVALPESMIQPTTLASTGVSANQEVIVIVRDRNNPDATSKVMTLQQPTADLMQMIERQAR